MTNNGIRNARVKATGRIIQVFRHSQRIVWVDAFDCTTEYTDNQLELMA
jgi:hypothetical protein